MSNVVSIMSWIHALRQPIEKAKSYPGWMYHSEKIFKNELNHIFSKEWVCVGSVSDFRSNGDTRVRNIGKQSVIITNDGGNMRAYRNVCRHRGAALVMTDGNYKFFSCPYHRWAYRLNGNLHKAPKADVCKEKMSLLPIQLEHYGNFLFANLDENSDSLKDTFGTAFDELKHFPLENTEVVRRKQYNINANWKLLIENFLDYYHLPAVHPELVQVSKMSDHIHPKNQSGKYCSFATFPLTNADTPIDTDFIDPFPELIDTNSRKTAWFHVFYPNTFTFVLPSHVFSVTCHPTGINRTIEYAELSVDCKIANCTKHQSKIDDIWEFYDKVNKEDIEISERVHIGTAGKYPGGSFVTPYEDGTYKFQNMIANSFQN